jgi:hypothetical protein
MWVPEDVTAPDGIAWTDETPTIVSLSDVHGYLDAFRSALTAVGETDDHDPLVTTDDDGKVHWADNDYLLLLNGDLIDRGPANQACLTLLMRLVEEAPPGRVRYHLGNHEMAVLFPDMFGWPGTYSVELHPEDRRTFLRAVAKGAVPAAFEGYEYTYSHAGSNDPIEVAAVNETAATAAAEILRTADADDGEAIQREIAERHGAVYGLGGIHGRGANAGLLWMDFAHMREDAPSQIVGHTRHVEPTRKGNAVCQNVIRSNRHSPGGECVLLETPEGLSAVIRQADGVATRTL